MIQYVVQVRKMECPASGPEYPFYHEDSKIVLQEEIEANNDNAAKVTGLELLRQYAISNPSCIVHNEATIQNGRWSEGVKWGFHIMQDMSYTFIKEWRNYGKKLFLVIFHQKFFYKNGLKYVCRVSNMLQEVKELITDNEPYASHYANNIGPYPEYLAQVLEQSKEKMLKAIDDYRADVGDFLDYMNDN